MSVTPAPMVPGGQTGIDQALTHLPVSCRHECNKSLCSESREVPRRSGDRVAAGEYFAEDKMHRKIPE